MSAVARARLTPAEYLAIERRADFRSEYFEGEMFAMAGARYDHNRIKDNIAYETRAQLKGGPCIPITSDMRVKVSKTGLYTYPDVVVVCGQPDLEDAHGDTLLNPKVIVEVLSESTEQYDRGKKFRHYRQIASLQEYVLVAHDRPLVESFVRQGDGAWLLTEFPGLGNTFVFGALPVQIKLEDIYAGVSFDTDVASDE